MMTNQATSTAARAVSRHDRRHRKNRGAAPLPESKLASYFKNKKQAAKLLEDETQRDEIISQMVAYAEKDHLVSTTEVGYGEALYNILRLPVETQKLVVWAIADKNGVARPEYLDGPRSRGRQPSGRKQLAEAQYGLWPDMLKLEGKNKDTRAGMQITDHVRRYRIKAGLLEHRKTKAKGGIPKRTLRRSFAALWAILRGPKEKSFLENLFERAGIAAEELETWEAEVPATKVKIAA